MVAGGALPGWAVGLSIFGTYLSSNTFLGVPGKTYATNFNAFVFSLSIPLAACIAARWFVPFYRRSGEISAYHHLEERFGPWARTYAVVCYLLTQVARMGAILFGVALGLKALTGWDMTLIIVGTGLLVTLYTLLGGIEAVVWTDAVQACVLIAGAILILALLISGTPGGVSESVSTAWNAGKYSLGSWRLAFSDSTVWVMLGYGIFINLNNFGIDQSFVQRYQTASSDRAALRALWFGALLYVPISLLFFVIGAALFSYYDFHPEQLNDLKQIIALDQAAGDSTEVSRVAEKLSDADIGDQVLPYFIATELPPGMAGLLIAAIFAAAMSSVDTSLNSSATVVLKDVYQRYWYPDLTDRQAMRVLRTATVVAGVVGTSVALALIGVKSILDAWWQIQGVFAGGVLGLFLLGRVARSPRSAPSAVATLLGILIIAWLTLSSQIDWLAPRLRNPLHANMTIVVGTLSIFMMGLLLNRYWNGSPKQPSADRPSATANSTDPNE